MELGVSVIVCCYNSAKRLPQTLKHLALQVVEKNIPWEIILIDNASSDHTSIVAKEEWGKYDFLNVDFKTFIEEKKGKIHAFQKGLKEAKYEYILTCDDDNWLDPDYIAKAYKIMESNTKVGVLGGNGIFNPEQPLNPEIEKYKSYYVNGPQKWVSTEHWVYGAGSVCRKSVVIEQMKKEWPLITSGRVGKKLNGGEDVELSFIFYLNGYKIIADDTLTFQHFVPLERQNTGYILETSFWHSYTNVLLNSYYVIIQKNSTPLKTVLDKWLLGIVKSLAKQSAIKYYHKLIKKNNTMTIDQNLSFQSLRGTAFALIKNRRRMINHQKHIKKLLSIE
jgi:glycosyltransferase involved in cell wall biosynthesis